MNRVEAIVHLYKTGYITEERAMQIADSKGLNASEKKDVAKGIEDVKNAPEETTIEEPEIVEDYSEPTEEESQAEEGETENED